MSNSEAPSPFSYVLSDDKATLTLVPQPGEFHYSTDDVVKLLEFFANVRAKMIPPIPDEASKSPAIESDRYEVFQDPQSGKAQIYLRIPGLIWTFAEFSKESCARLAETLNPASVAGGGTQH